MNSKASDLPSFIMKNKKNCNSTCGYEVDTMITRRCNENATLNQFGKELIVLCVACKLKILNGRTRGDFQGIFTYHGYNDSSTIDPILV